MLPAPDRKFVRGANRLVKGPLTDVQVVQCTYKFFDFFIAISSKNSWLELVGEDGQAAPEIVEKEK